VSSSANIPGEADPEDFYDSSPLEPTQLYQGEILVDIPILRMPMPSRWQLLRTQSGKRLDEALQHGNLGGKVLVVDSNQSKEEWQADNRGDYAAAVLDKTPVLILNQNCDVQSKDFLQVAPIFALQPADENFAKDLAKLKSGEKLSSFWIKKHPPEIKEESYADLVLIQAVHKTYIKRITPGQHFRLNAERTRLLQRFITRYFGRPNSYDAQSDKAPTTGTYLCVWCFYMDALVTKLELTEGSAFTACQTCGHAQWVVKGR